MTRITPYLAFNGNCREVLEFYRECLGGELVIQTFEDSPMAARTPEDKRQKVMHGELSKDDWKLFASDMFGSEELHRGNTVILCFHSNNADEMKTAFENLSKGGLVNEPISEMFFGLFGKLTDKYGMRWMFQADIQEGNKG